MKPGDHPDFFRFAPPPGTSRESSIRLDREGRFWHDGARVDHPAIERGLRSWIGRHPDDGRPILTSQHEGGYDFTTYAGVLTALAPGTMGRRWYASRNRVV